MSNKFEQLLDHLINENTEQANELFHEIVVEKSREIYESMIAEESDKEEKEKEKEANEKKPDVEEGIEENLDEFVSEIGGDEADDFMGDVEVDGGDEFGGDEGEFGDEFGDEEGSEELSDEEQTDRIMDLEDELEALKAEFEALLDKDGGEEEQDGGEDEMDFGDEEEENKEGLGESAQLTKVATPSNNDGADNTKSIVAKPNRMGGVTPKLGQGDEKGGVKGGLVNPSPKDMNTGNINTADGKAKAGKTFSNNTAGHGAEKKGKGESGTYAKSPLAPSHAK